MGVLAAWRRYGFPAYMAGGQQRLVPRVLEHALHVISVHKTAPLDASKGSRVAGEGFCACTSARNSSLATTTPEEATTLHCYVSSAGLPAQGHAAHLRSMPWLALPAWVSAMLEGWFEQRDRQAQRRSTAKSWSLMAGRREWRKGEPLATRRAPASRMLPHINLSLLAAILKHYGKYMRY